ncbi:MAG TPA: hypothetical protein VJZ50_11110 [Candidatus Limnocylindrales bacterium]|nr:hypothetical protein [Candidatus Limnocylindrales bacterium]
MAGKVPSRREAKKPPKSKKAKAKLEPFSEPPLPTVEEIKPRRKQRHEEGEPE